MAGLRLTATQGELPFKEFPALAAANEWLHDYFQGGGQAAFYITAPGVVGAPYIKGYERPKAAPRPVPIVEEDDDPWTTISATAIPAASADAWEV